MTAIKTMTPDLEAAMRKRTQSELREKIERLRTLGDPDTAREALAVAELELDRPESARLMDDAMVIARRMVGVQTTVEPSTVKTSVSCVRQASESTGKRAAGAKRKPLCWASVRAFVEVHILELGGISPQQITAMRYVAEIATELEFEMNVVPTVDGWSLVVVDHTGRCVASVHSQIGSGTELGDLTAEFSKVVEGH